MSRFAARFVPFRTAGVISRLLVGLVRKTFEAYANEEWNIQIEVREGF